MYHIMEMPVEEKSNDTPSNESMDDADLNLDV